MAPSKFNHGYRGNTYATHLCVVREGGLPPSKYPTLTFVKTSEIYVTYVTPVTDLKSFVFVLGWDSKVDLLSNEYGFHCRRAAVFNPSETRRNGLRYCSNNLWAAPALFLVIIVSPRRNIRVFWFLQFQFCKGEAR